MRWPLRRECSPRAIGSINFVNWFWATFRCRTSCDPPADTEQFIAIALATAHDCGFQFTAEDVRQALLRPPAMGGLSDGEMGETSLPPQGWLPIGTSWWHDQLYIQWSYFGKQRLREPFFQGSVQRCLFKPFNQLFRYMTPITSLPDWLQDYPGLRPSGFIFHMSRCGSTLVSQMLGVARPQCGDF